MCKNVQDSPKSLAPLNYTRRSNGEDGIANMLMN